MIARRLTKGWQVRGFWTYGLLQVPDILLAGLILLLVHRWAGLPSVWALGLFTLWALKDLAMYFLLRDIFEPSRLGAESLVGARAVVKEPLAPAGYVMLGGELWSAETRRPHEVIKPGTAVVVRASRGLILLDSGEQIDSSEVNGPLRFRVGEWKALPGLGEKLVGLHLGTSG